MYRDYSADGKTWRPDYKMTVDFTVQNVSKSAIDSANFIVNVDAKAVTGLSSLEPPAPWAAKLGLQPGQTEVVFYPAIISLGSNKATGAFEYVAESVRIALVSVVYANGMAASFESPQSGPPGSDPYQTGVPWGGSIEYRYIGRGTIPLPMTVSASGCQTPEKSSEVSPPRSLPPTPVDNISSGPDSATIVKVISGDAIPKEYVDSYEDRERLPGTSWTKYFDVLIDVNGAVCHVQLEGPDNREDASDRQNVERIKRLVFFPALKDGVPVAVWGRIMAQYDARKF
jgi:hypothetical protein